ncbi:MAG: GatB/YqeY domain-containing protein [Lewinellaceae bacterium]|nr:GatB/YqeY domain-containing protein [Phaeodactylibacter sp.]MCB9038115.1 GatB/YqeY domain-containing protein [Lewinellaceae bacterium]
MSLEERINQDLKAAMKAKDQAALRGIRAVKAAILLEKTSGASHDITEEMELKILQKLVKQRKDSLDIYEKQNREDLAQTEREEIEVIKRYLPKQLSREELKAEVKKVIDELGASSMKDMGMVMGTASKKLAGKADGKTMSGIVRELLNA